MEATKNQSESTITHFLLLGFQDLHSYRTVVFFVILFIYFLSIAGNSFIILLVSMTQQLLQTPMYFFLTQLSITDIMTSSSVCPTLLLVIWKNSVYVTIAGCMTQTFILSSSTFAECSMLTIMSYDRYLAICKPLHYAVIMNLLYCLKMAACAWVLSNGVIFIFIFMLSNLHFCGPYTINHFSCEFLPVLQLSCSDTNHVQLVLFIVGIPNVATQSTFIITTYIYIFHTILRIPSSTGRQKAFSTCSSHLSVLCTYYGTIVAVYLAPSVGHSLNVKQSLSLLYTVITPLFNPIIYSLKNREIHTAALKLLHRVSNVGKELY